jgi:general secretion pathway protein G
MFGKPSPMSPNLDRAAAHSPVRAAGAPVRGRGAAGFTLLELMVVLAILGVLAFVAAPPFLRYLASGKLQATRIQIASLGSALDLYAYEVGHYPTSEEGLRALVAKPATETRWNGPYLQRAEMIVDPWGHPYQYRMPGQHGSYDLYSLGPKGTQGGEAESNELRSW